MLSLPRFIWWDVLFCSSASLALKRAAVVLCCRLCACRPNTTNSGSTILGPDSFFSLRSLFAWPDGYMFPGGGHNWEVGIGFWLSVVLQPWHEQSVMGRWPLSHRLSPPQFEHKKYNIYRLYNLEVCLSGVRDRRLHQSQELGRSDRKKELCSSCVANQAPGHKTHKQQGWLRPPPKNGLLLLWSVIILGAVDQLVALSD